MQLIPVNHGLKKIQYKQEWVLNRIVCLLLSNVCLLMHKMTEFSSLFTRPGELEAGI